MKKRQRIPGTTGTFLVLFLLFVLSCEKEESDYRAAFIGEFHFTTVVESWQLNTDSGSMGTIVRYDTSEYNGFIRYYEPGDEEVDLYYDDSETLYPDTSLFIQFREHAAISTEINGDGAFIPRGGYHYFCKGGFIGKDSLEFSVDGLGGLGAGHNFEVTGSRK